MTSKIDPVLQNAIRYAVSVEEYNSLHRRFPKTLPNPSRYSEVYGKDDYNAAAIRASLRVFCVSQTGLKLWDIIAARIFRTKKQSRLRLTISLSTILLLHRLLHRFFARLRTNLLTRDALPFRRRNPRISRALTARLAPAIGASLAGFALAVSPGDQLRITVAIYIATRAAEFGYNALEERGYFDNRPWWFGSWMLMPPVFGQLLHAFVFDRDCLPKSYGDFILNYTPTYVQRRPLDYPSNLPWPSNDQIADGLAELSRLKYPPFISPILFPGKEALPKSLMNIAPITSSAHPAISSITCALIHPHETSCLKSYMLFFLKAFPAFAKFFTLFASLFALPRYKLFLKDPTGELNKLAKGVLRTTLFVTGAIGTSWASICLFQNLLPRSFIPTQRWFWGGFLGGFWGFLERKDGRGQFLYSSRVSIDSLWKVGVKKGWWKSGRNGDVWVFVMGLMVMNSVYELQPSAVSSNLVRRGLAMIRGEDISPKPTQEVKDTQKPKEK